MVSSHDKHVKKRKKRDDRKKSHKQVDLSAPASAEAKQMGKIGIIIFISVGIAAAIFIVVAYS